MVKIPKYWFFKSAKNVLQKLTLKIQIHQFFFENTGSRSVTGSVYNVYESATLLYAATISQNVYCSLHILGLQCKVTFLHE